MYDQNAQSNAALGRVNQALSDYWGRVAETYYVPDVFGRRMLKSYLEPLQPQSLVEVGCGSGELFSIFKDVPVVLGLDWQDAMLKRSGERIQRHEYKNIELLKVDITQRAQISTLRRFDVALTRTLLMHIDPRDIEAACRNMSLLSDRIIALEFFKPGCDEPLAFHNWHHEYPGLFKSLGYRIVSAMNRSDGVPQVLFDFKREKDESKNNIDGIVAVA